MKMIHLFYIVKSLLECKKTKVSAIGAGKVGITAAEGATYYAIGVVINQLVHSILTDAGRLYPLSVIFEGEYGHTGVSLRRTLHFREGELNESLRFPFLTKKN